MQEKNGESWRGLGTLGPDFLLGDGHLVGFDVSPLVIGIDLGELRSQKQDLRGVEDPGQEHDEGVRGFVGRFHASLRQIVAQGELADDEEHGSDNRSQLYVGPLDMNVGHELKYRGEQEGEDRRLKDEV